MSLPAVPYFLSSVVDVVGSFMDAGGLTQSGVDAVGVTWDAGSSIVRVSYYPEDSPDFCVSVAVAAKTNDGTPRWIGLWRAMPETTPARAYTAWSFRNEAELRTVLKRLVSDVLSSYGPMLWEHEARLATLSAEQDAEVMLQFMTDELQRDLALARWSFDNGRFAEARDRFALIGEDRLSAADRRRLLVAKAKAADDGVHSDTRTLCVKRAGRAEPSEPGAHVHEQRPNLDESGIEEE